VTRRKLAGVLLVSALVAAGSAATFVATRDGGRAEAADDNPLMAAPTTRATSTTARSTTTLPPLPVPEPPPADPYEDVPIVPVGEIIIPKIGVAHTVYEGVWLTVINEGPGHWPGTALPGERGNTVFPGHRTTYSRPFHDLDKLVPGDQVVFDMGDRDEVYEVRETLIVEPTDLWVVDQTEAKTFTLIACHPKGSAAQRIVVKGDHVATIPKAPNAAADAVATGA
jgi:sortase A